MSGNVIRAQGVEQIGKSSKRILPYSMEELAGRDFTVSSVSFDLIDRLGVKKVAGRAGVVLTGNRIIELTLLTTDTDVEGEYLLEAVLVLSTAENFILVQQVVIVDTEKEALVA